MRGSGLGLEVYADADCADKAYDGRSVSGIAVTLGGTVVSHAGKTQHVVSLSTSEAECIAAGDGVKEGLFVLAVLFSIAPETSGASIKAVVNTVGGLLASRRVFCWLSLGFFCSYSTDSD